MSQKAFSAYFPDKENKTALHIEQQNVVKIHTYGKEVSKIPGNPDILDKKWVEIEAGFIPYKAAAFDPHSAMLLTAEALNSEMNAVQEEISKLQHALESLNKIKNTCAERINVLANRISESK